MTEIALVYAPFPSREEAQTAATLMIAQKLAACANILGEGLSLYMWDGALESAPETVALFKTAPDRRDALIAALERAHPYDLPAIIHWRAHSTAAYAQWVYGETREDVPSDLSEIR